MPRRIYTYDAGQGWEIFNLMSHDRRVHAWRSARSSASYNFFKSRKQRRDRRQRSVGRARRSSGRFRRRRRSTTSPTIPTVTSRYPLWDLKSPELTSDVPHSRTATSEATSQSAAGTWRDPRPHGAGTPEGGVNPHATGIIKVSLKTAEELGIPMPYPTIKPLFVALFMTLMFA